MNRSHSWETQEDQHRQRYCKCKGPTSQKAWHVVKKLTEVCVTEASGPAAVGRMKWRVTKMEMFLISYGIIAEAQVKDDSSLGRVVAIKVEKHVQIQDIF